MQAAGIPARKAYGRYKGEPPPVQAFRALTGWLQRAQSQKRLAKCDVETLAATMLGALHGWASTARVCGQPTAAAAGARHVDRFIDLLWDGIGPE